MKGLKAFRFLRVRELVAVVSLVVVSGGSTFGQTFPYSINSWKEPDFKKRFLGTYGVASGVQPELNVESYSLVEGVYSLMDTPEMAIRYLNQGLETMKTTGTEPSAGIFFLRGNLYYERNELERATKDYIEAIKRFPTYRKAYSNLGFTFMELNRPDDALPMLLKAMELGENESQTHGLIGFCYLNKELYASAANSFRNALTFDPRYEPWRMGLLNALVAMEQYAEALPMATELLYLHPQDPTHWRNLASLSMRAAAFDEAITYFEAAHELGGALFSSREQLSYLYFNQRLYKEAGDEVGKAIELATEKVELEKAVAFCSSLSSVGEYESVARLVASVRARGEALGVELDEWGMDMLLAGIEIDQDQWDSAETRLKRLIQERPESGAAALYLARVYVNKEAFARAAAYFEIAQSSGESRYNAFFEHGSMLLIQRRVDEAIQKLEQAYAINATPSLARYLEKLRERQ